ncbi:hypothetical protein GCM10009596_18750 [Arthrobacter rhombi]
MTTAVTIAEITRMSHSELAASWNMTNTAMASTNPRNTIFARMPSRESDVRFGRRGPGGRVDPEGVGGVLEVVSVVPAIGVRAFVVRDRGAVERMVTGPSAFARDG